MDNTMYENVSDYCVDCIKFQGDENDAHSPICIPCTGKTQQALFDENVDRKTVNVIFPPQGDCGTGRILEVNIALPELSANRLVNVAVILKEACVDENGITKDIIVAQRITQVKVNAEGVIRIPKFTFLIPEDGALRRKRCFFVDVSYHYSGIIEG